MILHFDKNGEAKTVREMVRSTVEAEQIEREYEDKFRSTGYLIMFRHQVYKIKAESDDLLALIGYAYNNGMLKKISFKGHRGTFYIYKMSANKYEKMDSGHLTK